MIGRAFLPLICLFLVSCAPIIKPMEPTVTSTRGTPTAAASPAPSATGTPIAVRVIADTSLNVRQFPGENETVIGYLYKANTVTLTNRCSDGWAEIIWEEGVAWVNSRYLSKNKCQKVTNQ